MWAWLGVKVGRAKARAGDGDDGAVGRGAEVM